MRFQCARRSRSAGHLRPASDPRCEHERGFVRCIRSGPHSLLHHHGELCSASGDRSMAGGRRSDLFGHMGRALRNEQRSDDRHGFGTGASCGQRCPNDLLPGEHQCERRCRDLWCGGELCCSGRNGQLRWRDHNPDVRSRFRIHLPHRQHDDHLHRHRRERQYGHLLLHRNGIGQQCTGDHLPGRTDPDLRARCLRHHHAEHAPTGDRL